MHCRRGWARFAKHPRREATSLRPTDEQGALWKLAVPRVLVHRVGCVEIEIQFQDVDAGLAQEAELAAFGMARDRRARPASLMPRSLATRGT